MPKVNQLLNIGKQAIYLMLCSADTLHSALQTKLSLKDETHRINIFLALIL